MSGQGNFGIPPGALVQVDCDAENGIALIQPKQVVIQQNATVTWHFDDVPPGYQPLFVFENPGPFEFLVAEGSYTIIGCGETPAHALCQYQVFLIPLQDGGEVKELTSASGTPTVRIGVDPGDGHTGRG